MNNIKYVAVDVVCRATDQEGLPYQLGLEIHVSSKKILRFTTEDYKENYLRE